MIVENWSKQELDCWIAGVLDGDGCKNISDVKSGKIAHMNDREALETIHFRVGGRIVKRYTKGDNTKTDGTGSTFRKDTYNLRNGRDTRKDMPQSIAQYMLEPDNRARFYTGRVRMRTLTAPLIPWFAGYFAAEGCVNVDRNYMQIQVKDKRMLEYWKNRYGGHISYLKSSNMWLWYNHTHMTPTIIAELLPFMTNDKGSKMRDIWNHYAGKIQ